MTALTIHATKPFPAGLLATLKQVKAELHAISPDEDFSYLHSLTTKEEEEAFKQATKENQRRFWSHNSHLL